MQSDDYTLPDYEQRKPYWFCESCSHESHTKAMPKDREAFYARIHTQGRSPTCPKCKSESYMPVGF